MKIGKGELEMVKLHLKKNQFVYFYGERYTNNFEYWTTADTYQKAMQNLRVDIAKGEFFTHHIGEWIHITIDKEELEVIECWPSFFTHFFEDPSPC